MVGFTRISFLAFGILAAILGLTLVAANPVMTDFVTELAEHYLSADQHISDEKQTHLIWFMYYSGVLCWLLSALSLASTKEEIRQRLRTTFLADSAASLKPGIVLALSLAAVPLCILFAAYYSGHADFLRPLFYEDGVFETLSALAFGWSAWLFFRTFWRLRNKGLGWVFAGLAIAMLFVALEELSWGQRVFRWQTPDFLASVNEQGETSVHNIATLSGLFEILYLAPVLLIVPVVLSIYRRTKSRNMNALDTILPHPSLSILIAIIGAVALTVQGELLEELLALFFLLYSYRISHYRGHSNKMEKAR